MEKKWKIPFFLVREYKIFILFSILSMHLKIYKGGIGMVLRGYRLQGTDLTGITQEIKKIRLFLFYRRTIHIWSLISEVELFCLIKADPT